MSTTSPSTAAAATLPADLRLGPVHLTVRDLDRSIPFYERSIGLRLLRREGPEAALGAGDDELVVLVEEPDARPAGRHAGLYHFALLHPSRAELAHAAQRLLASAHANQRRLDHNISEAIYLPDPDGNGIELAADRPREHWGDLGSPATIGGPLAAGRRQPDRDDRRLRARACTPRPTCAWGTCTCTSATWTGRSPSGAVCSASR